jgi:hypothetical protein
MAKLQPEKLNAGREAAVRRMLDYPSQSKPPKPSKKASGGSAAAGNKRGSKRKRVPQ